MHAFETGDIFHVAGNSECRIVLRLESTNEEDGLNTQMGIADRKGCCKLLGLIWILLVFLEPNCAVAQGEAAAFTYQALRERARQMAGKEYRHETNPDLPDFLKNLNYDEYKQIDFRAEETPWANELLPFDLHLFHRGYLFSDPVRIHVIDEGKVRDLRFSAKQFKYGTLQLPKPVPEDLQFAGFNILFLPHGTNGGEVASFLGASYFRLVGLGQRYGASFRGLAINTAEPSGEEFPAFTEFWIEKPGMHSKSIQVYALLDSPSCAGAYRLVITPGAETVAEVEATVYMRKDVAKLGTAPLTSMFLMAENNTRFVPDFRPEVHDSDGLLLKGSDKQWLWRPLSNPVKKHQISRLAANNPAGFGLLQRDTNFHHYEDLVSRYEMRPSLWVEPRSDWGAGTVELVEIPSPMEGNDNIVAYWVPAEKAMSGREFNWRYELAALRPGPAEPGLLRVEATRIAPEHNKLPPRIFIDFVGGTARQSEQVEVEAKVETSRGEVKNLVVQKNDVTGGWRVFFDLTGTGNDPAELKVRLHNGDQVLSEVWTYLFQNEPPL